MSSYWERRAQESRQRSLAAQASRYSGQASQFDNVSRRVGEATGYGGVSSVVEAQARRRREEEAERVRRQNALRLAEEERRRVEEEAAQRAQAEARVAEARRRREAEVAAEDAAAQARLRAQYGEQSLFPGSGTGVVRTSSPVEQAEARARLGDFVLGPERRSVFGGEAGPAERVIRDWGLSEQEFRTAGERAGEGRLGAAAGWAGLGLAGAIPFVGDAAQAAARAGRAVESAADVGRGAGAGRGRDIVSEVAADVVNSANPNYTLPPERLAQAPKGREPTAEVFYRQGFDRLPNAVNRQEFQNLAARTDEYIPLYRGIRGGTGSVGSVSTGRPDEVVDAVSAANDFVSGNLYHGGGAGPDGSYFSPLPDVARNYSVGGTELMASSEPGAVISALLPRNARIARLDDPALVREFNDSGYSNIGTFAAAKGYDALLHESGIHIVLNRSALVVDDTPLVYRFGQNEPIS